MPPAPRTVASRARCRTARRVRPPAIAQGDRVAGPRPRASPRWPADTPPPPDPSTRDLDAAPPTIRRPIVAREYHHQPGRDDGAGTHHQSGSTTNPTVYATWAKRNEPSPKTNHRSPPSRNTSPASEQQQSDDEPRSNGISSAGSDGECHTETRRGRAACSTIRSADRCAETRLHQFAPAATTRTAAEIHAPAVIAASAER